MTPEASEKIYDELTRLREIERLAGELADKIIAHDHTALADCAICRLMVNEANTLKAKIEEGK